MSSNNKLLHASTRIIGLKWAPGTPRDLGDTFGVVEVGLGDADRDEAGEGSEEENCRGEEESKRGGVSHRGCGG